MKEWTYEDWLRWQKKVIREEMKEQIDKESDKRAPAVTRELMRIQRVS